VSGFGDRLADAIDGYGRLCVGIDPHESLLELWGLPISAEGARQFGLRVVEAAVGQVGVVKPQVAFFERFGAAGYRALEDVLASARAEDLLVIADAKRGDIGSTIEAYAAAWLTPGSSLEADAMTISAFQGVGSIEKPMQLATETGKGLFVLAATSNPESVAIQLAKVSANLDEGPTRSVARVIIDDVSSFNARSTDGRIGSVGVVLGATLDLAAYGIDTRVAPSPGLPVLAPGFGFQGARIEDAPARFGSLAALMLVSESRSLLQSGPSDIAGAVAARAAEVRNALG
jgi:orotidine-5'-phosphate decarboxylase